MNEKTIIKSDHGKKLDIYSGILIAVGGIITFCIFCDGGFSAWIDYAIHNWGGIEPLLAWGGLGFLACGLFLYFMSRHCELYVTDKRIYGKAAFGNRVDIPIDSISAVGLIGWLNGISVSSSSGFIKFYSVENITEVHEAISNLILNRNTNKDQEASYVSVPDELLKYKQLYDQGVLTEEEFITKKEELLKFL